MESLNHPRSRLERFTGKIIHATSDGSRNECDILAMHQKDKLYSYQMTREHPAGLAPLSFWACGFGETEYGSERIFDKLHKAHVLTEHDTVDTAKIGKPFTHQLAIINKKRQKQLVDLLFWWEEECQRLSKLLSEKADLEAAMVAVRASGTGDYRQLRQLTAALERVRAKLKILPSQRNDRLEDDLDLNFRHHFEDLDDMRCPEVDGLPPEYSP